MVYIEIAKISYTLNLIYYRTFIFWKRFVHFVLSDYHMNMGYSFNSWHSWVLQHICTINSIWCVSIVSVVEISFGWTQCIGLPVVSNNSLSATPNLTELKFFRCALCPIISLDKNFGQNETRKKLLTNLTNLQGLCLSKISRNLYNLVIGFPATIILTELKFHHWIWDPNMKVMQEVLK